MTDRERFELSSRVETANALAGRPLRPLGHLSGVKSRSRHGLSTNRFAASPRSLYSGCLCGFADIWRGRPSNRLERRALSLEAVSPLGRAG